MIYFNGSQLIDLSTLYGGSINMYKQYYQSNMYINNLSSVDIESFSDWSKIMDIYIRLIDYIQNESFCGNFVEMFYLVDNVHNRKSININRKNWLL